MVISREQFTHPDSNIVEFQNRCYMTYIESIVLMLYYALAAMGCQRIFAEKYYA